MESEYGTRCERFIRNRDAVRRVFRFQSTYIYPLCAALYTARSREVDEAALDEAMRLLKANVGVFSHFRGLAKYPIASLIALDPDPEARMNNSLIVYDLLKEEFFDSTYLPVAAVTLAELADPAAYAGVSVRTRALYLRLRQEHPLLTSSEDAVYAAMLALSPRTDDALIEAMEECYRTLKPHFLSGNAVQALSAVLALGDEPPSEMCAHTLDLYDAMAAAGLRYGKGYELPTLGALVLSGVDTQKLVADLGQINAFLSRQRGFGAMGIGRKQRLMYAALLLLPESEEPLRTHAAAISGTLALIIAQQAAIAAAVAASAASSSSN